MTKIFNLAPRKPNALSEQEARKLEEMIAAKGEGVAGQAATATVLQPHELTSSSAEATESIVAEAPRSEANGPVEMASTTTPPRAEAPAAERPPEPAVAPAPAQTRNAVSSRARTTTKPQARELPTTQIGTFHNPRIRKTDGVKTRSTTVHLPIDLAERLAVHCARSGRRQSDFIAEAVAALLG